MREKKSFYFRGKLFIKNRGLGTTPTDNKGKKKKRSFTTKNNHNPCLEPHISSNTEKIYVGVIKKTPEKKCRAWTQGGGRPNVLSNRKPLTKRRKGVGGGTRRSVCHGQHLTQQKHRGQSGLQGN